MVSMGKTETRGCQVLLERRGAQGDGVTKDPRGTKEKEETWGSVETRVNQDGTASREDPKERPVTSALWVSQGEMAYQEVQEKLGKTAALAEGDLQEPRATGAVRASQASRESRAPEAHRAHLVPSVLQA